MSQGSQPRSRIIRLEDEKIQFLATHGQLQVLDIYALGETICFLASLTISTLHFPVSESGCCRGQGWQAVFQGSLGSLAPGQFLLQHAGNISQPTLRLRKRWCPSFCPYPISQHPLAQLHLEDAGLAYGLALLGPEGTPIRDAGELATLCHQK